MKRVPVYRAYGRGVSECIRTVARVTLILSFMLTSLAAIAAAEKDVGVTKDLDEMTPGEREEVFLQWEKLLSEKAVKTEFEEHRMHWNMWYYRSLGKLRVGAYGELIILPLDLPSEEDMLYIYRGKDAGLEIVNITNAPKIIPYATVAPDGKYVLASPPKAEDLSQAAAPLAWPFKDDEGRRGVPQPDTVIARGGRKGRARTIKMPKDCLDWCYLDAHGTLRMPDAGGKLRPFENVLWQFHTQVGGLRLTHSGPLKKGDYARVSPECVITYCGETPSDSDEGHVTYWWPYVAAESGRPLPIPRPFSLEHKPTSTEKSRILPGGEYVHEPPLIIE